MKRSPDDIARAGAQFLAFVTKNPGLRIEQINRKLNTKTSDLALPIRKLRLGGRRAQIKTKGQARATMYYATGR